MESGAFRYGNGSKDEDEEYAMLGGGASSGGLSTDRKKRAGNTLRTSLLFYLKFLVGIGCIEAYFAFCYSSVVDFASMTQI
jgi:hypothetical protein